MSENSERMKDRIYCIYIWQPFHRKRACIVYSIYISIYRSENVVQMFNAGSEKISRPVTPCWLLPKTVMLLLIIRKFYCLYFLILVKSPILWTTKYYWKNCTVTVLGVIFTLGFGHIWRVDCNMLTFSDFGPQNYKLPQTFSRVIFSDLCFFFYILTIFISVPIS